MRIYKSIFVISFCFVALFLLVFVFSLGRNKKIILDAKFLRKESGHTSPYFVSRSSDGSYYFRPLRTYSTKIIVRKGDSILFSQKTDSLPIVVKFNVRDKSGVYSAIGSDKVILSIGDEIFSCDNPFFCSDFVLTYNSNAEGLFNYLFLEGKVNNTVASISVALDPSQ